MRPPASTTKIPAFDVDGEKRRVKNTNSPTPLRSILLLSNSSDINENDYGGEDSEQTNVNSRCDCCPYGFHIDLGFVKFAEDVVSGREQYQVGILF